MNAAHVRELQTYISCQVNIDEVKVECRHNMRYHAKRAATVFYKDKVTAQKKLKKHAASYEAIVGDAYQIFIN